ncbi:hypothetical protein [Paenibacillus ehimensis]|uniref:hypothetical protein n=1 Tax=Paenibacillus ehimensis TaxID=79264 RepID=UPI000A75FE4D|nr:hypothetical protein [Paenibacillus ehimensis]
MESPDLGESSAPAYHPADPEPVSEEAKRQERDFRKKLNRDAREVVSGSIHHKVKLVVHRPDYDQASQRADACRAGDRKKDASAAGARGLV